MSGTEGVVYDDHGWEAHRLCIRLRMGPHSRESKQPERRGQHWGLADPGPGPAGGVANDTRTGGHAPPRRRLWTFPIWVLGWDIWAWTLPLGRDFGFVPNWPWHLRRPNHHFIPRRTVYGSSIWSFTCRPSSMGQAGNTSHRRLVIGKSRMALARGPRKVQGRGGFWVTKGAPA